jgi:hypothetical protein
MKPTMSRVSYRQAFDRGDRGNYAVVGVLPDGSEVEVFRGGWQSAMQSHGWLHNCPLYAAVEVRDLTNKREVTG